jgi:hypothetical protein
MEWYYHFFIGDIKDMALYKEIRQPDGVVTHYHRILYLTQTVNCQNSIAVVSYTDEEAREMDNMPESIMYKNGVTYEVDYDESMTISTAYDYLKTLPQFEDAKDV